MTAEERVAEFRAEVEMLTSSVLGPPRWEDIWKNMERTVRAAEDAAIERGQAAILNLIDGDFFRSSVVDLRNHAFSDAIDALDALKSPT